MCVTRYLKSIWFCALLLVLFTRAEIAIRGDYILHYDIVHNVTDPDYKIHIKAGELRDNGLELFCNGEEDVEFKMYYHSENAADERLSPERINKTTIRIMVTKRKPKMEFKCQQGNSSSQAVLSVNGPPTVKDFHCILHRDKERYEILNNEYSLVCAWTTTNKIGNVTLRMLGDNPWTFRHNFTTTEESTNHSTDSLIIMFNETADAITTLSLLLEYCNYTLCLQKTFDFYKPSITKLNKPRMFSIVPYDGKSKTMSLIFAIPLSIYKKFGMIEYKVEYKMSGGRTHLVNTIENKMKIEGTEVQHLVVFDIPCVGRTYNAMLSIKPKQALDDRYWSDRLDIPFATGVSNAIDLEDDACFEDDKVETPEIIMYGLIQFRIDTRENMLRLRSKIRELKARAAQMNARQQK